jgi:hypothetical protein
MHGTNVKKEQQILSKICMCRVKTQYILQQKFAVTVLLYIQHP